MGVGAPASHANTERQCGDGELCTDSARRDWFAHGSVFIKGSSLPLVSCDISNGSVPSLQLTPVSILFPTSDTAIYHSKVSVMWHSHVFVARCWWRASQTIRRPAEGAHGSIPVQMDDQKVFQLFIALSQLAKMCLAFHPCSNPRGSPRFHGELWHERSIVVDIFPYSYARQIVLLRQASRWVPR